MWCVDPCKQLSIHTASCLLFSVGQGRAQEEQKWGGKKKVRNLFKKWLSWKTAPIQLFISPGFYWWAYIAWCRIFCWPDWVSHPAVVLSQLPVPPQPTHWGSRWEKENLEAVLFSNTQSISVLSTAPVTNPKRSAIGAVWGKSVPFCQSQYSKSATSQECGIYCIFNVTSTEN